jgi:LytS/YehU family sensor histidine kinase
MRFDERLRVREQINRDTLPLAVPPLLLQTLVENAVKHGVSRQARGGEIGIGATAIGGRLTIRVTNTGQLIDDDGRGFGLRTVRERLRLLYGDTASLTLNESGDTTVATVVLPVG